MPKHVRLSGIITGFVAVDGSLETTSGDFQVTLNSGVLFTASFRFHFIDFLSSICFTVFYDVYASKP